VDGQRHAWHDGEWTMFDETYVHYARNDTAHDRVILFCDVERPMKWRWAQAFNRFVARNLLAAGASPNQDGDQTGGINRLFRYFYAVRWQGAEEDRPCYAIKWGLVLLVVVAIIRL
jgi:beta-hydroxylase